MPHARIALAAAACSLACSCKSSSFERPFVDKSGGALPELAVQRVAPGSIVVDGKLDEPAWQRTAATEMFVSPGSGRPAPESKVNAFVRVAWDDAKLYFAFVVHDPAPSSPFSRDDVDPHVWAKASGVEVMLQPRDANDNRDYYEIQVDVHGAVWDTHFDDYNRPVTGGPDDDHKHFGHEEWQAGLERAVSEGHGSYRLELALPFRALSAEPVAGQAWRANFYSFKDGQGDALAWSPLLGQGNFHRASRFGRLRFAP